jgi:C4-dicarboxylate transporter, DcuC family
MEIGIACFAVFLIMAALMYTRRISALLALPIMAVAIALVGQIPAERILKDVIAGGSVKLANAYTTTIFGAILAELINKLGIAKALVRWVAEFAGDSPFLLGLFMTMVTALLFTSLGGLGAVIMVGTVVLPVMLSLGISPITAGSLFLFGISLGGMFNLANWQLYVTVLSIEQAAIASYVVPFAAIISAIILLFLTVELKSWKNISYLLVGLLLLGGGFAGLSYMQNRGAEAAVVAGGLPKPPPVEPLSITITGAVLGAMLLYAVIRHFQKSRSLPGIAFLTPAVPLLLVLLGKWEIIPAFLVGIAFAVFTTWQRDSINTLTRSIIEGAATVAPAVVLMLGIGMLLAAVMDPKISSAIAPLLTRVVPTDPLNYVLVFTVLAPLALYRGPLSLWGMGSGIVTLIRTSTALGANAIMGMLMSVGQLQGICDPTNTHNVWIATYLGTDTQSLLKRTLPYAWMAVFGGLLLAVVFGYVGR